ncbi:LysR family transcriptional regulator [Streptomyces decoyicus]
MAQPVLSCQIKALEQELECTLLVRTTRRVELTAAGKQLHEEAQKISRGCPRSGAARARR